MTPMTHAPVGAEFPGGGAARRTTTGLLATIAHLMRRLRPTFAARLFTVLGAVLALAAVPLGASAQTTAAAATGTAGAPLDPTPDPWALGDAIGARLDGRWTASRGVYLNEKGLPDTRLNSLMLQLHSMAALAGHQGAIRRDERIAPLAAVLTQPPVLVTTSLKPRTIGHFPHAPAWTPAIGENPEQATLHPSIDTGAVRALTAAWRVRAIIGMDPALQARIPEVFVALAHSPFYRAPSRALNQINWHTEVYAAALEVAGDTSVLPDYRSQLLWFAQHSRSAAYPGGSSNLTSGGGFRYLPNRAKTAQLNKVETTEYGNLALSSLGFYTAAVRAGMVPLPAKEVATLQRWARHMLLGSWTHAGYPNWDTGLGTHRRHLRQYWAWSLDGLIAASGPDSLLGYPKQRAYALKIVSNGIALFLKTAWTSAMGSVGGPLPAKTSFGAPNGFSSGSGNELIGPLRFAVLDAALDGRFQNITAAEPPSWFAHDAETGRLAFSTRSYNGAILPSRAGQAQGGTEPVRLFDGAQNPLTGLGGRGDGTLGVTIVRNGAIRLDTQPAAPTRQTTRDVRLVGLPANTAAQFGKPLEVTASASANAGKIALRHRFTKDAIRTTYRLNKVDKHARVAVRVPVWGQQATMTITRGATRKGGRWVRNSAPLVLEAAAEGGGRMTVTLTGLPAKAQVAIVDVPPESYLPIGARELMVVFKAPKDGTEKFTRQITVHQP